MGLEFAFAICSVVSSLTLLIALYACHRAINAEIEVKALKNSTHQIQYVPAEELVDDGEERELNKATGRGEMAEELASLTMASEPL